MRFHYFLAPDPLLDRYRKKPLHVALYGAIVRACLIAREPVPLSATDLATWLHLPNNRPSHVAIRRALTDLEKSGWLTRDTSHRKAIISPTWGRDKNQRNYPYNWDAADYGRPAWQRGRRIPLALFDLLGQITPHPTQDADHATWFDQLLLDGIDVGIWMIHLRQSDKMDKPTDLTPRLRHLGLTNNHVSVIPFQMLAHAGVLTTLINNQVVVVSPTPICPRPKSAIGSPNRSCYRIDSVPPLPQQNAVAPELDQESGSTSSITWDESNQQTNMLTPPDSHHVQPVLFTAVEEKQDHAEEVAPTQPSLSVQPHTSQHSARRTPSVEVRDGHMALNPGRTIPPGEWFEMADLETLHGTECLLIWQARAARRRTKARNVVPAYYEACARQTVIETHQPRPTRRKRRTTQQSCPSVQPEATVPEAPDSGTSVSESTKIADPAESVASTEPVASAPVQSRTQARPTLGAEAIVLLTDMGIQGVTGLRHVPLDLIQRWRPWADDSILRQRFRDPAGWIYRQLEALLEPPSPELRMQWQHQLEARTRSKAVDWRAEATKLVQSGIGVQMGDDATQREVHAQAHPSLTREPHSNAVPHPSETQVHNQSHDLQTRELDSNAVPRSFASADEQRRMLLHAMHISWSEELRHVPLALIRCWQPLVDHPVLIAEWGRDRYDWICVQLCDGHEPPMLDSVAGSTVVTECQHTNARHLMRQRTSNKRTRQILDQAVLETHETTLTLRCAPRDVELLYQELFVLRSAAKEAGFCDLRCTPW